MCTSITYKTLDNECFLARTMDYDALLPKELCVIPRSYLWHRGENRRTKYAVLGMGAELPEKAGLYDGVNENGLMCATLMFTDSLYSLRCAGADNVTTCDFVLWILSQFKSVSDLLAHLNKVCLVFGGVPPLLDACALHWIVTDGSSRTVVIEQGERLAVYENPVFALTNEPDFPCQLENLQRYRCVNPLNTSCGLPGDFSSESRFVRAAYSRRNIGGALGETAGLTNCFKILDTVQVPKGVDCSEEDGPSYTQYTACMCAGSRTYYYNTYHNRQINAVRLLGEDLDAREIKKFPVLDSQSIHRQN